MCFNVIGGIKLRKQKLSMGEWKMDERRGGGMVGSRVRRGHEGRVS